VSPLLAPHPDATQREHPMRARATRAVTPLDRMLVEQQDALAALDGVRDRIGVTLQAARYARRLTVKEAATLAGVRATEVGYVEHYQQYKKVNWRADVADRLAQCYARIAVHPLGAEGQRRA
jgi:hypothetical protein